MTMDALTPDQVAQIFEKTQALLTGHFLLTSGLHSAKYLQCARVLQWPEYAGMFARAIAAPYQSAKPDLVLSPAIGGITIGYEAGRVLGCRAIFAEREEGKLKLRRGFVIEPGEKVLVVEDVITTGGSTRETMEVAATQGGIVIGAASLVDRSGGSASLGVNYHSLWTLSVPAYSAESCPLCQSGSKPVKPGSRK
jgi:orotate phosphoribosyltransferase